jgi:hypothetical protein
MLLILKPFRNDVLAATFAGQPATGKAFFVAMLLSETALAVNSMMYIAAWYRGSQSSANECLPS